MKINANVNIKGLLDKALKAQKNLVYSTVQGINATAKPIQADARERLGGNLALRTPQTKLFMERQAAVIKSFASVGQGRLFTEISVGQRPKLLLSSIEDGGERKPFRGRLIAHPVTGNSARKNFKDPIAPQFTFKSMALKAVTKKGEKRFEGKQGTYTVAGVGVFRRLGSGRRNSELLYAYANKQQLSKKLGWRHAAQAVADKWLEENITRAYLRSLKKK